ncbi:HNH endonuclease signature motif containing protein [Roseibacterium sp. SDUM158017]|uniref:HNH endonuclease n=1 Tax=Roseicyclus salinarum TaxID=3036773 RepID=UPI002414F4B7|nr:HNH endonuclease signature motif containing protein [Roseibacterium sp. SDUM158017]MDG4650092.1 HNH endonuclease signature motif containing protein [Roseibacterium sp. SDUM158017]
MTRRMSMTRRVRIFEAAEGVCHICGHVIDGTREAWDVDHVVPYALTRDDSDDNLRPAHELCHRGTGSKTSDDVARIAKAKRVRAKHIGAARPKSTIPGSKGSKWKRRLDGKTVRRDA